MGLGTAIHGDLGFPDPMVPSMPEPDRKHTQPPPPPDAEALGRIEDPMARLLAVMAALRHPEHGCPWDLQQDFASIAPHTVEEAYEVADAIQRDDRQGLLEECGDLLFQVVYYAQMASEDGSWTFQEVADQAAAKMIDRHPHVFAGKSVADAAAMTQVWEQDKAATRIAKARAEGRLPSALDDVATTLPALIRAGKLQKRAARVGFDWKTLPPILDKIEEELNEFKQELAKPNPFGPDTHARLTDELGDVLFAVVNLARVLAIDPEAALAGTNAKFERRFRHIEAALDADGLTPDQVDLDRLERHWAAAKDLERDG